MISIWRSDKLLARVLLQVLPVTVVTLLALGILANRSVRELTLGEHQVLLDRVAAQSATAISLRLKAVAHSAQSLAANDLVINSLIDLSERQRYIPMLFQSLRIANSEHARVTLADYRGRRIASNAPEISYVGAPWIAEVMGGQEIRRISETGMIIAVPAYYAGLAEGIIVVELDVQGLAEIMKLPVQADAYRIATIEGNILFRSDGGFKPSDEGDQAVGDWVTAEVPIEEFQNLNLVVGNRMATVLAPLERRELFLLGAILFSIAAVAAGIVVTALKVTNPLLRFIENVQHVDGAAGLAFRIEPTGPHEFQRLAENFNAMLSQIESTTTSRDYVDGVLNSMNEFMVVVSPDGKVESANRALAHALGCRRRDILGRDISGIVSGDLDELIALADDDSSTIERELKVANGIDLPVRVSATRMKMADKTTGRRTDESSGNLIVMLKDITDQVRAKATIDRHIAELERSNADLEQFAYVASHDLKAPLRAIDNLAGWIEEDVSEFMSDDSREHMNLLRSRINRLEALLEGLLQYARTGRDNADVTLVNSGALVAGVVEMLGPPDSLQIRIADDLPDLTTTQAPLQQVLHNLIGNAIKHHDRDDGFIEVTGRDLGDHFEFTVSDDGPGIPAEFHEKVFQMFQTLKRRDEVEGSGIGLAVVQKLVRTYGGTIAVISSAGERGTAFRFTWKKHTVLMEKRNAA